MAEYRNPVRALLYPGLDLHTRNRAVLARYWQSGERDVLDAGCGNGYFAWLAYRSGARVVAMNIESDQLARASDFLLRYRGADPQRLRFERRDLNRLDAERRTFDEILCYEVLEHVVDDAALVTQFFRLLKPGGMLHLCCPNRVHPRHMAEVLDHEGRGGHVRAGYTGEDYRRLLEPVGFRVERIVGVGSRAVYRADALLRSVRARCGDAFALPLLPLALPFVRWSRVDPPLPFSLYATAVKPQDGDAAR